MNDLATLESDLLGQVDAAPDEAALESVRVSALGKKGAVSELLKTLGAMIPRGAQGQGPAHQWIARQGPRRDREPQGGARRGRARAAPSSRAHRRHLAGARGAGDARAHPSDQPGHRRAHRDLRRHGLLGRGRSRHRDRLLQLHGAQLPARAPGPRDARHLLPEAGPKGRAQGAAHPHVAGADPHHALEGAADPRDLPGPHLPPRTPTRPTRRCSIRSRGSSSTGTPTSRI